MLRSIARVVIILPLFLATSQAQTLPQRDAQALTLASQSLQAADGATVLTDATLQGTANYVAGSDQESGTFTLQVKGNQESKLVLNLSGGQRTEIRQGAAGEWVDAQAVKHAMALHNCWVDASWLFPTFSVQGALNDPQVTAAYLGRTVQSGVTADHLQFSRIVQGQTSGMTAEIQGLSAVDIYLDAGTHLPVGLDFNTHPDNDFNLKIPVEIQFSGYQKVNGVVVPMHIQKLIQGTLTLDLAVTSVTVNSGIADSDFAVQ